MEISPNYAHALTVRGAALTNLDRNEEALRCHEQALALEPDMFAAHINLGNTLGMMER